MASDTRSHRWMAISAFGVIDELVAEIGACFLGVQLGVQPDFDQSAAYVKSWLRALKDDKDLIFKAAAEAQKAVDHINAVVSGVSSKRSEAA